MSVEPHKCVKCGCASREGCINPNDCGWHEPDELTRLRGEVAEYKRYLDAVAKALHPHKLSEGWTYLPDQLPGMVESLRRDRSRWETLTDRGWCLVPPNQEAKWWTVFKNFDGEFGYDGELATGGTPREAMDVAMKAEERGE